MKEDTLFQEESSGPFVFDQNVSSVFDDMAKRSIPWYEENLRMCEEVISTLCPQGSLIVDLGCSTGNAISRIVQKKGSHFYKLVGVDKSSHMLSQAKQNFLQQKIAEKDVTLLCLDISTESEKLQSLTPCQCFLLRYTLQFINLEKRKHLLTTLRSLCAPNGFLLLSEKISNYQDSPLPLDDWYHQYKHRNGYSWLEIQRKKQALQGVLTPLTIEENLRLLKDSGFAKVQTIFHWYNFVTFFVSIL